MNLCLNGGYNCKPATVYRRSYSYLTPDTIAQHLRLFHASQCAWVPEAMQAPVATCKPHIASYSTTGTLSIALHEIMTELMGNLYNFMHSTTLLHAPYN